MSVRPSVCPHGTIRIPLDGFYDILYFSIFRKSVEKIEVLLKSDKSNVYFTWRPVCIYDGISLNSSQNEMFQMKVFEEIRTHSLCSIIFFFCRKSRRFWDSVEQYGWAGDATDGNIIQRMRIKCCLTKATDSRSEYGILVALSRQQWLRERASVLHIYVHCLYF